MFFGRCTIVFTAVILIGLAVPALYAAAIPSPEELATVVPGAGSFERVLQPIDHFRMKDAAGREVGAAFVTSQVPPAVAGYGGEIDVLVGIDLAGRITGARVLAHHETPALLQRILDAGLLQRLVGKRPEELAGIEAISGATISSQAITEDVRTAAAAVAAVLAGRAPAPVAGAWRTIPWTHAAAVLALCALAVAATLAPSRRWLRAATLALAVAAIGFWLNTPVTVGDLVDLRNLSPSFVAKMPLLLLIAFAFAAALVRGNLYCSYLCPFGALQEGAARLVPKKCCPDPALAQHAGWLRWVVLLLAVAAIAAGSEAFRTVEPFATCFLWPPDRTALVQAGAALAAALAVRRIWCRFFCPTGLAFDLAALLGAKVRREIYRVVKRQSTSS